MVAPGSDFTAAERISPSAYSADQLPQASLLGVDEAPTLQQLFGQLRRLLVHALSAPTVQLYAKRAGAVLADYNSLAQSLRVLMDNYAVRPDVEGSGQLEAIRDYGGDHRLDLVEHSLAKLSATTAVISRFQAEGAPELPEEHREQRERLFRALYARLLIHGWTLDAITATAVGAAHPQPDVVEVLFRDLNSASTQAYMLAVQLHQLIFGEPEEEE